MKPKEKILVVLILVASGIVIWVRTTRHSEPVLPVITPFIQARDFYERAFALRQAQGKPPGPLVGILVSHHLLAAPLIVRALSTAPTGSGPLTVVIIAPDHFYRGAAPLTTAVARWQTPYGILEPDAAAVASLATGKYILEQTDPFVGEHGIYNLTSFIAHQLPQARIVPLIVKDTAPAAAVAEVATRIANLPGPVLIIGSFDFTHDATVTQAETNDRKSLPIVSALAADKVAQVAVDSHAGLATFLVAVAARGGQHFTLLDRTNSARLTGNLKQTDVTSYIIGYFTP